ncbi:hypothetical protein TNCV_3082801 [Trichonephila clavipes]|nr:hypothetical protein TNCV_3082801 [Trichonephila clavipes]
MQRQSEWQNVSDSLLLELFLQQLPPNVQSILASIQPLQLKRLLITRGLKGVYAFIDDILIASQNVQEHTTHLRALFERLDYYGLTIKPSKCAFGVDSLKFLGFQVSSESISPLPDKVDVIQKFRRPNTITQLRRFLGMYNFYRRFIPKAAHVLAPLIKFLEGHTNKTKPSRPSKIPQTPLEWTEEVQNSFTAAKTALADAIFLKHPIPGATF